MIELINNILAKEMLLKMKEGGENAPTGTISYKLKGDANQDRKETIAPLLETLFRGFLT